MGVTRQAQTAQFAQSTANRTITPTFDIKVGDILIASIAYFDASLTASPTISDNQGGVWSLKGYTTQSGGNSVVTYVSDPIKNFVASGNYVITGNSGGSNIWQTLSVVCLSGARPQTGSNTTGTGSSNSATCTSTVAVTNSAGYVYSVVSFGGGVSVSAGTNFTLISSQPGGTNQGIATEEWVGPTANQTGAFSFGGTTGWAIQALFIEQATPSKPAQITVPALDWQDGSAFFQTRLNRQAVPSVPQVFPPVLRQENQQLYYDLPEFNYQWWQQVRQQPVPTTFLPLPPAMRQRSQQLSYEVPDYDYQWWEQYRVQPNPVTFLPLPPTLRQGGQQLSYSLPDYDYSVYEQFRKWPVPLEFSAFPPVLRQGNQQLSYELPSYDYSVYEQFRKQPQPMTFLPVPPTMRQGNQQLSYNLPEYDYRWYEQYRIQPNPVTFLPLPPAMRQGNQQLSYELPDYSFPVYEQRKTWPVPVAFVVPAPPPAHSQYVAPLPDYDYRWYEQRKIQPVPSSFLPPPPLINPQHSQYLLPQPDYDYRWYQQTRRWPIPPTQTLYVSAQQGLYGVEGRITGDERAGEYRVQNDIAGYNVYIGVGALPDLSQPPAGFSHGLPVSVPVTPPLAGTTTVYVLVRYQDHYGLESANQNMTTFVINSAGVLILNPIPAPTGLVLSAQPNGKIRVTASYPGATSDRYPADEWRVWVDTVPPNTTLTPTAVKPVQAGEQSLTWDVGTFTPATYHIALVLYRSRDGASSPEADGTVIYPAAPGKPTAVPGGLDLEP